MPFLFCEKLREESVHMATTRLIPLHKHSGKSIAQTLEERKDYAENPEKTNGGELVTAYQCDPRTADIQFALAKSQYAAITGREQGRNDVLAYHLRQAFKPGEITPEFANKIGYELALRFTKGKHQFIVATHIDKVHVHNHIIFNSTTIDCTRKFRDFFRSGRAVRRISDRICVENGLSIVEKPGKKGKHYGAWFTGDKPPAWSEKLRKTIDVVLEQKPADTSAFIQAMQTAGYEVKTGKYLAFRASGQKKFTRLRSLGGDYTDSAVLERIDGKRTAAPKSGTVITVAETTFNASAPEVNLLIDVQNSIKAKNSPG
jgi:hypothetical protein